MLHSEIDEPMQVQVQGYLPEGQNMLRACTDQTEETEKETIMFFFFISLIF